MDLIGYIIAGCVAIGVVIGVSAMMIGVHKRNKIKAVELAPWKVKVEFED